MADTTQHRPRRGRLAGAVALCAGIALALIPALPAAAVQTNVTLGGKSCTGDSFLASRSNANATVMHKVHTTAGFTGYRQFNNTSETYLTFNYYTGQKGTVVYDGVSYVYLTGPFLTNRSTIGSAYLFCDV